MDILLFILLVAAAGLLRLLTKAASATKNPEPPLTQPTPSPRVAPTRPRSIETDEERIRRFMEALGNPTASRPPEPLRSRPTYQKPVVIPHLPPFAPPYPPLKTRPPVETAPSEEKGPPPLPTSVSESQMVKPVAVDSAIFEIQKSTAVDDAAAALPDPKSPGGFERGERSIASLLRSPTDLGNAIILREIFCVPRGLQAFDFGGSA